MNICHKINELDSENVVTTRTQVRCSEPVRHTILHWVVITGRSTGPRYPYLPYVSWVNTNPIPTSATNIRSNTTL